MKTTRLSLRLAAALLLSAAFTGAASAQPSVQAPARVVLGAKALVMVADILYAFPGIRTRIAAVAGSDQGLGTFLTALDPSWASKPAFDRQAGAETYAALKPDLVALKSSVRSTLGVQLEALGIATFYVDLETPEDYFKDIAAIGERFGEKARAVELAAYYGTTMEDTAKRVAPDVKTAKPKVLVVQAAGGAFEVPPSSWMQTRIVEMAGGIPVWKGANPGNGWGKVTLEQIAAWNPDFVFVVDYRADSGIAAAALGKDPAYSALAAWKSGSVYGFPQDFYSWDQPDTRWILGLRWEAKLLHPSAFADVDIRREAGRFFKSVYLMDDAAFESHIAPRLKGDHAAVR
ncbi:MAG: ABC transporter substrate-binding protein [Spirochaetes bacterium]|nr:ABC transporter substrate-binding protein [Spirochaetota bacterium]